MLKLLARIISWIMHPLFIIAYVLAFLILSNPYAFGFSGPKSLGLTVFSVLSTAVMFPAIAISMMKALGLVQSFEMHDKKERIGPLVSTGIFYMWLYMNIRNNDHIPGALSFFVLGCTISIFMALVINSFTKVSLHTIAAGGLVAAMLFFVFNFTFGFTDIPLPFADLAWRVSDRLMVMATFLLAGGVGFARLYLRAHHENEIYGGYLVGIFSQILAFRLFF